MCGGFTCSKNSLIALNFLYVVVAITLISVAAYAKLASIVPSVPIVTGIIACGVFLLIISIVGIVAASKHHQVLLFFYMIILFFIFIIQFSVACACLAITESQERTLAKEGWKIASMELKHEAEKQFHCCGFDGVEDNSTLHCNDVKSSSDPNAQNCCPDDSPDCCYNHSASNDTASATCLCDPCNNSLKDVTGNGLSTVGGIGLFFSFTEIVGFLIAKRYRHEIDPRANIQSLLH